MALWGGRFETKPDELFKQFNDSLPVDAALALQDVEGSIAWAKAIHRAGVLNDQELARLTAALSNLKSEVSNSPALPLSGADEDIHSWVERRLIEAVGDLGKKLHTGRSRNDQVATDFRLFVRAQIDARLAELKDARRALIDLAERTKSIITSGYTHLQRAQPILFAHWALAYQEMLERDAARLRDARKRVNISPLGSGALAGTTYQVDREQIAKDLGFDAPTRNSLDATSDRDFVLETLSANSITALHLSRLAEDLILFASQEFAVVEMHDSVSSGSSLMPQKKNPDACELIRGKAGRIFGAFATLAMTVKGLPLAYNKDLQEDKEPLIDSMQQLSMCLRVLVRVLDTLKVREDRARNSALDGHANATELADYLVAKGVPFRDAHDIVGKLVRLAIEKTKRLEDLPLAELQAIDKRIDAGVFKSLELETGLARREIPGGTGPRAVSDAIDAARTRLQVG
ncbi:MAG: argininosuccinate lyase [Phycisphaeraceae bacterium]|nr:argininosuccinate lyase [Phycisphaeraceae bacterium]